MLAGRHAELTRILEYVGEASPELRCAVICGEAGIGKTSVWRAVIDELGSRSHRVLVARPGEDELQGSLVGLGDLFAEVATDTALLDPDTDPFDRGREVLRLLRKLTTDGPVALAIDDVQWLDPLSARALRYALRRVVDEPVAVIATQRTGAADGRPALLPPEHTLEVVLGGLDEAAMRELITPVATNVSRPKLSWICELSAGNPMYALELARNPTSDRMSTAASRSLRSAISRRLADVPAATRQLVQTVAALGAASPEQLARAPWLTDTTRSLADAVDRQVLTLDRSMVVRCTHPLLGSVMLAEMDPAERRDLHGRLRELVTDPEDRARHLALSRTERDGAASAELEEAALRIGRRGGPALAADFAAHSVRLTPLDDRPAIVRRAVSEVLHRAAAGETSRAIAMVDAVLAGLPPGPDRIAALTLRVGLDFGQAPEILARADEEAQDELTRGRVLDLLAYHALMIRGRLDEAQRLEAEARDIALRHHDEELELLSSATWSMAAQLAGRPRPDLLERATQLARPGLRLGRWPDVERARQCLWNGELATAQRLFEELYAMTVRSGIEFQRPYRKCDLAMAEIAAGNVALAAELADDGLESALDAGNWSAAVWVRYPDGLANAHLGNTARAALAAEELRTWGNEHDEPPRLQMADHVAGVLALASGEPGRAARHLEAGVERSRRLGHRHPGAVSVLPDAVDAAAAAQSVERAAALASELDEQSATLDAPWVRAAALRARGVVATATGDEAGASMLAAATEAFDELGYRLDAARRVLVARQGVAALGSTGDSLDGAGRSERTVRRARSRTMGAAGERGAGTGRTGPRPGRPHGR